MLEHIPKVLTLQSQGLTALYMIYMEYTICTMVYTYEPSTFRHNYNYKDMALTILSLKQLWLSEYIFYCIINLEFVVCLF